MQPQIGRYFVLRESPGEQSVALQCVDDGSAHLPRKHFSPLGAVHVSRREAD